ncbi:TPA: hypothetical protein RQM99_001450 [Aeromonas dhakensis]|nr:hypothetical protein [Aeromonas dhakensis]
MKENLGFTRVMMVIGSLSPFFVLAAIKGSKIIDDKYLLLGCLSFILIPNLILYIRISCAVKNNDKRSFVVKSVSDNREHLLVYLFAVLVPLYQANLDSLREISMLLVVLLFVVFLFLHLNLHYMNFVFALFGYKIYSVEVGEDLKKIAILSKRDQINRNQVQHFLRISNTVYIDI